VRPWRSTGKQAFAWALVAVSTVLLISFGGAIVAAPVTAPLLLLSARASTSKAYRIWAGIVVALTIAELAWALTYLAVADAEPAIWLAPMLAMLATIFAYVRLLAEPAGASRRAEVLLRGGERE
jgi:hypothetical protein